MFSSEPMQKVRVIAFSGAKYRVIKALQSMGIVDLRKSRIATSDDSTMEGFSEISDRLVRAEGALQILLRYGAPKRTAQNAHSAHDSPTDLVRAYDSLDYINSIFQLNDELALLKEQSSEMRVAAGRFASISGIDVDLKLLSESAILSFRALSTDMASVEQISLSLAHSKLSYELIKTVGKKGAVSVLVIFRKSDEKQVFELVDGFKHTDLELPHIYLTGTPSRTLSDIENKITSGAARIDVVDSSLAKLSKAHYHELAAIKELLEVEYGRMGVSAEFKRTESAFAFEGWIPKKRLQSLRARIDKATGGAYEIEALNDGELAPTYFNRSGFMRPFQYLMEFYSLPRSDEIDPTYIFMITLAIFYGIMVSDVGYGLVSLAIATLITKKTNPDGLLFNVSLMRLDSASPSS